MFYIFQADLMCEHCAEKYCAENIKEAPEGIVTCRNSMCNGYGGKPWQGNLTDVKFPGSLGPECWFKCPNCGDTTCAVDEYTYDSDHWPKGDPNSELEPGECCGYCHELIGPELEEAEGE